MGELLVYAPALGRVGNLLVYVMKLSRKTAIAAVLFAAIALPTIALAAGPGNPSRPPSSPPPSPPPSSGSNSWGAGPARWRRASFPCRRLRRLLARASLSAQVGRCLKLSRQGALRCRKPRPATELTGAKFQSQMPEVCEHLTAYSDRMLGRESMKSPSL